MTRPLYFGVVVWGERFQQYVLHFMLKSLMAPGNFPCSFPLRKVLLVCCPASDWAALNETDVFRLVRKHVGIEWIEFTPDPTKPIPSMSRAHALCFEKAFDNDAYLSLLAPDAVYSAGLVSALDNWITEGQKLVLCPAFRTDETAFFDNTRLGDTQSNSNVVEISAALVTSSTIRSLHSEILVSDLSSDYLDAFPNNFHLRAIDGSWFVSRNLSWWPILIDLSGKKSSGAEIVANSVVDSYALAKIFSPDERIVFVTDSSTAAIGSWGPKDWNAKSMRPQLVQRNRRLKQFFNDLVIRSTVVRYAWWGREEFYDWIKVRGLRESVMLGDISGSWSEVRPAEELLRQYIERSCGDVIFDRNATRYQLFLSRLKWLLTLYAWSINKQRQFFLLLDVLRNKGDARPRAVRRLKRMIRISA